MFMFLFIVAFVFAVVAGLIFGESILADAIDFTCFVFLVCALAIATTCVGVPTSMCNALAIVTSLAAFIGYRRGGNKIPFLSIPLRYAAGLVALVSVAAVLFKLLS